MPEPMRILSYRRVASLLLLLLLFSVASANPTSTNCYYPDGATFAADDVPCNQSAVDTGGHSPCCNPNGLCLDNGLCFSGGVVSRGSCTDTAWGTDCPQFCTSNPSGGMPMFPCDPLSATWACGNNNTDCQDGQTFTMEGGNAFVLRGNQVSQLENGQSVALLVGPTTTLTPGSGTTNKTATSDFINPSAPASQKYTVGDIAGATAGTGGALLLLLIGAVVMIFDLRRKLRREREKHGEHLAAVEKSERSDSSRSWYQGLHFQSKRGYLPFSGQLEAPQYGSYPASMATQDIDNPASMSRFRELESHEVRELGADRAQTHEMPVSSPLQSTEGLGNRK